MRKNESASLAGIALLLVLLFGLLLVPRSGHAEYSKVVTFGADLTRAEKRMLAAEFGIDLARGSVPVVEVTNREERKYLQGLVPEEVLGRKAISSAAVEMLPAGQGIRVQTRNVTWVTADMYANALVTARVKDARVIVAAPYPVSGTAALTGIFKAVEVATGKSLGDKSKRVANEELVETGNLGQEIGKDRAVQLILLVKERVVAEKVQDPEKIRQIIINVAGDLNINLNERQIEDITVLMRRISGLKLSPEDISNQLNDLRTKVERAVKEQPQFRAWLQMLLDAIDRIVQQVRAIILGEGS